MTDTMWRYRRNDDPLPWTNTRVLIATDVIAGGIGIAGWFFAEDDTVVWRTNSGVFIADELVDAWCDIPERGRGG